MDIRVEKIVPGDELTPSGFVFTSPDGAMLILRTQASDRLVQAARVMAAMKSDTPLLRCLQDGIDALPPIERRVMAVKALPIDESHPAYPAQEPVTERAAAFREVIQAAQERMDRLTQAALRRAGTLDGTPFIVLDGRGRALHITQRNGRSTLMLKMPEDSLLGVQCMGEEDALRMKNHMTKSNPDDGPYATVHRDAWLRKEIGSCQELLKMVRGESVNPPGPVGDKPIRSAARVTGAKSASFNIRGM